MRRDIYDDTIFLIDEPELHINTSIQKKLLIEINKIIGPNCQIWISTHSIGFLRALQTELQGDCSVIEFEKDAEYASKACSLTPMKPGFHSWRSLFSTALDDLATLVCPSQLIYCEGRDMPGGNGEERGFDAQFYNKIFANNYPNTLFVSSGGNTELDQRSTVAMTILGKFIEDLDILVLKDRDSGSGVYMSGKDRSIYLKTNSTNHRMLKRVEIENYAFDKDVVRNYCKSQGTNFDEATYDAHITDIVNQDVKDKVGVIKNICEITSSINADKFKLLLAEHISSEMPMYSELEDCIFKKSI